MRNVQLKLHIKIHKHIVNIFQEGRTGPSCQDVIKYYIGIQCVKIVQIMNQIKQEVIKSEVPPLIKLYSVFQLYENPDCIDSTC